MGKKSREKEARRERFRNIEAGAAPPPVARPHRMAPPKQPPSTRIPAQATALVDRVQRLLEENKPAEALSYLQQNAPQKGQAAAHRNLTALCLVALHRYNDALPLLQAAVHEFPGDLSLELALAQTEVNLGLSAHMERRTRKLSQMYSNNQNVTMARDFARGLRTERERQAAELGVDPAALEESMYLLEETYLSFGGDHLGKVVETCRRAIEACPAYEPPHLNLSTALTLMGDTEAALAELEILATHETTFGAQAAATLVRLYVSLGRPVDANRTAALLRERSSTPDVRWWQAQALACLDDHQGLVNLLKHAPGLDPREQFILGTASANLGDLTSARRSLHHALDNGYNHPLVVRALDWIEQGRQHLPYLSVIERLDPSTALVVRNAIAAADEGAIAPLKERLDADPDLHKLLEGILDDDPLTGVRLLCNLRTPAALQAVRDFVAGSAPLAERLIALGILRDAGEVAADEPVEFPIAGGEARTFILGKHAIAPDRPISLPDESTVRMVEQAAALAQDNPEGAYDMWVAVDAQFPSADVRVQIARLSQTLQRMEQSREWLEKARELDPNSAAVHIGLAFQCLNEANLRGALEEFRVLENTPELTVTEFLNYQVVRENLDSVLQSPLADALMAQADITADPETAEANRELAGLLGSMQKSMALTQYLRQRPVMALHEGLTLSEIVERMDGLVVYNAAWLFGLLPEMEDLQIIEAEGDESLTDDESEGSEDSLAPDDDPRIQLAREQLAASMLDPKRLQEGLPGLPERDLKGLRWLLDQGGTAPLEEYLKEFPVDDAAPGDMLLEYGILAEGRLAGAITRLIPVDLREPLRTALDAMDEAP